MSLPISGSQKGYEPGYDSPAARFAKVYADECATVRARRGSKLAGDASQPLTDLRGIALSGGGIRSATFCLGVLQQLAAGGRLRCFDYLSTVSGGGFIGGWWTAWLSRPEQRGTKAAGRPAPPIFPNQEDIELNRQGNASGYIPEASRSAGVDPIHHVRLFSNYLTPRKGALSGDTWRAITVISRNLVITFLTLLPILASAVFLAQLYFVADRNLAAAFVCGEAPALAQGIPTETASACGAFAPSLGEHPWDLQVRLARALVPIAILLAWLALVTLFWALAGTGDLRLGALAFAGVLVMLLLAKREVNVGDGTGILAEMLSDKWLLPVMIGGAVVLTVWIGLLALWNLQGEGAGLRRSLSASQGEVLTNRLTRFQTVILTTLSVFAVVLIFAGFSHELARLAFAEGRSGILAMVAKAGGWGAAVLALVGSLYTAIKAAPTGGADNGDQGQPGRFSALMFTLTPPLVIVVLMVALATLSQGLLGMLAGPRDAASSLHVALFIAMFICAVFAIYEFLSGERRRTGRVVIIAVAIALGAIAYFLPLPAVRRGATGIAGFGLGLVAVPWVLLQLLPKLRAIVRDRSRSTLPKAKPNRWSTVVVIATPLALGAAGYGMGIISKTVGLGEIRVTRTALAGMTFAAILLGLMPRVTKKPNLRTMWLLTLVYLLLGVLYVEQFLDPNQPQVFFPQAIVAFIGVALATVVGLGWLTDPNYLSLHTFYRARLVRAYLGASNVGRLNSEITESVEGDDIPLASLAKEPGTGPYHLINTTLNLVAARDLAMAQRSAAAFTLSPHYCGSLRTGYRPTHHYMGGRLTLGTSLAVSGAAASPNMGAKTSSAALAMLMALLNVRLGFWAPNPAQERWRVPRARLWPFYLLREFLSQTNDLSSYCYLTDGGHFDNTGLYSLVQRGCRNILLVDCGADPRPCFADLGDAIRRCRIDFGADIKLSVNDFLRERDSHLASAHFATGDIIYDPEHLQALGWSAEQSTAAPKGFLLWIKPSLLENDPAEVRQYALENNAFPQQTTSDQWFDEAQFESYRRLGMECASVAFDNPSVDAAFPVR